MLGRKYIIKKIPISTVPIQKEYNLLYAVEFLLVDKETESVALSCDDIVVSGKDNVFYRYMSEAEKDYICSNAKKEGKIYNFTFEKKPDVALFYTTDFYTSVNEAQQFLSLENPPRYRLAFTINEERSFHAQQGEVAPISKGGIDLRGGGWEFYICHKEKVTTLKIQYGEDAFLRLN